MTFLSLLSSIGIVFGTCCNVLTGMYLFTNQNRLRKLFAYCERISSNDAINEASLAKIVQLISKMVFIVPISGGTGVLLLSYTLNVRLFLLPTHLPMFLQTNVFIFTLVNIYQTIGNIVFWHYACLFLASFIIFTEHFSKQYFILGEEIKSVGGERSSTPQTLNMQLNYIGKQHSVLLSNLEEASTIFRYTLLINEAFIVMSIVMSFTIFLHQKDDFVFGLEAIGFSTTNLVYPLLGQRVSSSAEQFGDTIYECLWLGLTPQFRKRVALMQLVSQRPVGFSSGGFHMSNHMEISQVSIADKSKKSNFIFLRRFKTSITDFQKCLQYLNVFV